MFKSILCATDLDEASAEAVKQSVQLAHQFDSKIIMLNVHEEFMSKEEMGMLRVNIEKIKRHFEGIALIAKKEMKGIINKLHAEDIEIDYILKEGKANKIICDESINRCIDLIVMGVSEKKSLTNFIFNNTASYVIEHVDIPVLVVPIKNT